LDWRGPVERGAGQGDAMYIKEVSIDGFKSYAQRVTLTNFDPGFNAITGLNGSGKSNILDSICFVLGIKNLSQVSIVQACPSTDVAS
jgi:recombinational DNA repair ATPase RecF